MTDETTVMAERACVRGLGIGACPCPTCVPERGQVVMRPEAVEWMIARRRVTSPVDVVGSCCGKPEGSADA